MRPYQVVFLSVHMLLSPAGLLHSDVHTKLKAQFHVLKNIAPVDCNSYHFEIKNKIGFVSCTRAANSTQQDPDHAQRGAQENQHGNGHHEGTKKTL